MITENGSAWYDPPHAINGRIHDPMRVDYLTNHLKAAHDAIALGVRLEGYTAWSLLDIWSGHLAIQNASASRM